MLSKSTAAFIKTAYIMYQKLYSKLQNELERSRSSIETFAKTAPNRYKVYTIPKRTSGHRVIAHPSRELKKFQRTLNTLLADTLKPHFCSMAYAKDLSIKDNAQRHSRNSYLLKLDFNDFFNSIEPELFFVICELRKVHFSNAEKRLLTQLCFWNKTKSNNAKLVLSVGAPSSPMISNFVMSVFDELVYQHCRLQRITYTRYADDLTFSTNRKNALFDIPSFVESALTAYYASKVSLNAEKTCYSSKKHNRHVTGITISNTGELSLGRERKRTISAMTHNFKVGKLDSDDYAYLQGLLSFAAHIEPKFVDKLRNKYGDDLISVIIKGNFNE